MPPLLISDGVDAVPPSAECGRVAVPGDRPELPHYAPAYVDGRLIFLLQFTHVEHR